MQNGFRGTVKAHRDNGTDLSAPFIFGGQHIKRPTLDGSDYERITGKRFERVEVVDGMVLAYDADNKRVCLGGAATRFWMMPVVEADGDELDGLTFPELMKIAQTIKLPGRGVARKPQLVAGIRAHRAA